MTTSISDYKEYRNACMKCAHDAAMFNNFRQNAQLRQIWEHVTQEQGQKYYDIVINHQQGERLLWNAKDNDNVGNPTVYDYGYYRRLSPTTLRYIKVALDLYDIVGEDLFRMNIAEIGGGYGGQSTVIKTSGDYCIYDLPETCSLISRFTNSVSPNSNIFCINTLRHSAEHNKYDLIISNYAWSELEYSVQTEYYDNIIKGCDFGYITCNYISELFGVKSWTKQKTIDTFTQDKHATILPENPLTHTGNMVVIWTKY